MARRQRKNYAAHGLFIFRIYFIVLILEVIIPSLVFCQIKDRPDKISDKNIEKPETHVLYVDAASKSKNANGSKGSPFSGLRQAFSYIKSNSLDNITIYIAEGNYKEKTLTIPCNIKIKTYSKSELAKSKVVRRPIIKNTKIINQSGYIMELQNISFEASSFVLKNNSTTILKDVDISYAPHQGIYQEGGTLKLVNVALLRTKATNQQSHSGTGILLVGGVTAILHDVQLAYNEDGAFRIEGTGSRVYANKVTVKENGCKGSDSAHYTFGNGAVEVSKGAVLFMENSIIMNNEFIGVFIFEGGKAHIRNTTVEGTTSVRTVQGNLGGANITVYQQTANLSFGTTELELTNVTSTGSDFCGLQIIDAWIRCQDVTITGNMFGLNIQNPNTINSPGLDVCFDNTSNYNNEVDYSLEYLPVPDPAEALDTIDGSTSAEQADTSCCAHVSFEVITID